MSLRRLAIWVLALPVTYILLSLLLATVFYWSCQLDFETICGVGDYWLRFIYGDPYDYFYRSG